jgi:RND family efflux transporter MFP subunit
VQKEIVEWDEFPGRLEPVAMVEVRARVTGYLQSVNFKDGAEVNKGDLLFVIDPRPFQAELERAQADLKQAETRLALAQNEWNRSEKLLVSKAISDEEADSRRKMVEQTQAAIQSAKATVDVAKLNLDYTRIVAPISGRIGRKLITEGNLVNGSQGQSTLLTTIVSLDPLYCYFDADEPAVQKFQKLAREGKLEGLREGKIPCELELANETGYPHKGLLDFFNNTLDPTTGTLRVRGVFPNPAPERILQPGFFARVRVPGSAKYLALQVPDEAIGIDQGQKMVFVVNATNVVEYRKVEVGPVVNGLRIVRAGIQPGDWVVVNGTSFVRPGAKVNPTKAAASPAVNNATATAQQ